MALNKNMARKTFYLKSKDTMFKETMFIFYINISYKLYCIIYFKKLKQILNIYLHNLHCIVDTKGNNVLTVAIVL